MIKQLIPTIYFYLLSAIGMVLFIIGLFNSVHYIVGVTAYDKYPLRYNGDTRCDYMPKAIPVEGEKAPAPDNSKEECLKGIEKERVNTKHDDLEKSISFTAIGLLVFASHFYFARKKVSV